MNRFLNEFKGRLLAYWDTTTNEEKNEIVAEVLAYANLNQDSFRRDIKEIQFDPEIDPLPVVLEALSKNTDIWGDFYISVLKDILQHAREVPKPWYTLRHLTEFAYIDTDTRPFVQKIVDVLFSELNSQNEAIRLKMICTLPDFMENPSIRNKEIMITALQQKLDDKDWKARYLAFQYLGYAGLLPPGRKIRIADKCRKWIFGEPDII